MKEEREPIAVMQLTNTGGIGIFDLVDGDYVTFAYHTGERWSELETREILYNDYGDPYFIDGECEYELSNFMLVNRP